MRLAIPLWRNRRQRENKRHMETPITTHISPTRTSTIWIEPHMDLDKNSKPNDDTRRITRRRLMKQQHSTQKQSHYPKPQHNTAVRNMPRNIECKTTSVDEKRITWHSRLRAHMTRKLLATMGNQQSSHINFGPLHQLTPHVGNMWNSAWNSTLTLIHRRPDSIVLQSNTNKYLFLSKYNHSQQCRHDSNRTRKKKLEHRIHSQESH